MPSRRSVVRLADVAAASGVSLATASRSLAGATGVSLRVAENVRKIAADLGYVPNPHARSLAGGPTSSIGLIVHEIGDPYFSEIASGVLRVATREGLTVEICHSGRDAQTELLQIRTLIAHQIGGIIIAGSGFVDPDVQAAAKAELHAFRNSGGRLAVIGRQHFAADAVLPDNLAGGRTIAEHVLSLGHRRIAVAAGSRVLTTVADRLAGIEQAFREYGLAMAAVPVIESEFNRQGGRIAAARIVEDHSDVTAIIALSDAMAIGVLSFLRENSIDVPGRMSVSGFDDVAVAGDLAPSLTTVRLPMGEMGEAALTLALKPPAARPRRQRTGHELVVRHSTSAPARR